MKILVFDTCFNKSYIVLSENDKILTSKIIESTEQNYHSAYIIPTIKEILKENKILIKDINAIGINIGPGSFTGIRAGITIARVLAQQFNIKLIGIESLKILSFLNNSEKEYSLVLTDARKNKVYTALYKKSGETVFCPKLEDKENIFTYINEHTQIITDKSINEYLKSNNIKSINYEENDSDFGLYLSKLVYNELTNNTKNDFHWAKVKPLYIQQPSITKPKELNNV